MKRFAFIAELSTLSTLPFLLMECSCHSSCSFLFFCCCLLLQVCILEQKPIINGSPIVAIQYFILIIHYYCIYLYLFFILLYYPKYLPIFNSILKQLVEALARWEKCHVVFRQSSFSEFKLRRGIVVTN